MRSRGSCRFEPYFKVQFYDQRAAAWKDIQRSHPTESGARAAAPVGVFRLVTVSESGRTFGAAETRL